MSDDRLSLFATTPEPPHDAADDPGERSAPVRDLDLNPAQRAAVEHPPGPLLVIAGAGSGKTRVLTARVAWLLERGARPDSVLAFTFTNRAAREMRERIGRVVGEAATRLWVGTFHATGVRLLRREAGALGIARDFSIYDRDDQESVLKGVLERLGLPESAYKLGAVLGRISDAKNALVDPAEMARLAVAPYEKRIAEAYGLYRDALRANGALDFDDLIAETVRLLRDHPEIAERYAGRFRHVLVDEYQDTNHAQFLMVRALASVHGDLFAVGDDDQSIYGWRGARLQNVLDFETSFPGATMLRLEQNYRSTGVILKAANAVIANNRERKGKTLWCDREDGASLTFVLAEDEVDESRAIRGVLSEHVRRGGRLADCAVLYRTNAQSRAIETDLRKHLIPYEIVGGVAFYQRREVKDLLAYLRLAVQPADTVAFWRVWNTPRRGLGPVVRALVEARAERDRLSPLDALRALAAEEALTRAARHGAVSLAALIDDLRSQLDAPVDQVFGLLLERTSYLDYLAEDEDAKERIANVEELGAATAAFAARGGTLAEFLAEAALVSDIDRMSDDADRALLLTAHNAKGLEFPLVVVAGLEEGLFPHASSLDPASANELEEERRLFYVALTRARDRVVLTAAAFRRRYDGARGGSVSRFVDEIPAELLIRDDRRVAMRRAARDADDRDGRDVTEGGSPTRFRPRPGRRHRALGREVYHESFGRGVVMDAEGEGPDARYTVRFGSTVRKIVGRFLTGGSDGD
jgi:DNA helicase-2/ATP-dependent DNA helicase PcrA